MLELTETDFDLHIARGTFVVDFSAEWCPPCRVLAPIFERTATAITDATFATVDAERNGRLLLRFKINTLPTIVVFRAGQPVRMIRGLRDEKSLVAELRKAVDQNRDTL